MMCLSRFDIVWSNGRGVNGVWMVSTGRRLSAKVGLKISCRDFAVLDRVEDCPLRSGETPRAVAIDSRRAMRSIASFAFHHAHQETHAGSLVRCQGYVQIQAGDRIKRRMGRGIFGRAKGQSVECPRRPETLRSAEKIDSRGEEADGFSSAAINPIARERLSQARMACSGSTYSISANRRWYWVCPRSASGRLSSHSRYEKAEPAGAPEISSMN